MAQYVLQAENLTPNLNTEYGVVDYAFPIMGAKDITVRVGTVVSFDEGKLVNSFDDDELIRVYDSE